MAAYRYWRARFSPQDPSSTFVGVNEMYFRDRSLALVPTTGGTALASGSNASYPVGNAFDGNLSSYWRSATGAFPHWVGYDFGAAVDISSISFLVNYGGLSSASSPNATTITIQVSTDGVTWADYPLLWWVGPRYPNTNYIDVQLTDVDPSTATGQVSEVVGGSYPRYAFQPQPPGAFDPAVPVVYPPNLVLFGGATIRGTLKVLTAPARRLVRLFDRGSGRMVRETFSNTDGSYKFEYLDPGRSYFVVGFDDMGQPAMYNAAVADMLRAVP